MAAKKYKTKLVFLLSPENRNVLMLIAASLLCLLAAIYCYHYGLSLTFIQQ